MAITASLQVHFFKHTSTITCNLDFPINMKFGFNSEEIYSSIPDNSSHLQISVDIFTCSYLFILYFKLAFNLSLISLFLCLKCMQNSQWEISSGRKKKFGKIVSRVAQLVKNLPSMRETRVDLWVGKIPWRRERPPTLLFWPGEFHGVAKSRTQLSDFYFHF